MLDACCGRVLALLGARAINGQRKRPEPEQSCQKTASRRLAQDVLRPFFANLADSIIDYAHGSGLPVR